MSFLTKTALLMVVAGATVVAVRHAEMSLNASVPKNMPRDSRFLASGFDLANNESEGDWIACRVDAPQQTDWCRVTDQSGSVVYQGDFLPLNSPEPLPAAQLNIAGSDPHKLWVAGPAEAAPVPVIHLRNGSLLVPVDDRDALRQRWANDPAEYNRVTGD